MSPSPSPSPPPLFTTTASSAHHASASPSTSPTDQSTPAQAVAHASNITTPSHPSVEPPFPAIIRGHSSQSNIRIAPPSSTPLRFSHASLRHDRQYHSDVDPVLLQELQPNCCDVPIQRFTDALLAMSDRHHHIAYPPSYSTADGGWTSHPGDYTETVYGPFLEDLINEIVGALPSALRRQNRFYYYYASKVPFQGSGTGQRRADFVVANIDLGSRDPDPPRWADILVVGELSKPYKSVVKVLVQLGEYARAIFVAQPGRRYVPAFYLYHDDMTLFQFDRAGVVRSTTFNITNEPEHFLHTITAYATLPEHCLGTDSTVHRDATKFSYHILVGDDDFVLQKLLFIRASVIGRATACWSVQGRNANPFVIKDSWREEGQSPESDMYERARQYGVPGIAILHKNIDVAQEGVRDDINSIRERLERSDGEMNVRKRKRKGTGFEYSNRIHTRLVLQAAVGRPIDRALPPLTAPEFFEAIRDAIICHRDLFAIGGILHRDVSPDNILLTTKDTKLTGDVDRKAFLIDYDYSVTMDSPHSGASFLTGKLAYLALDVANAFPNSVRSDLESFFYVICTLCTAPTSNTTTHPLAGWHGTEVESCASKKFWNVCSNTRFEKDVLHHLHPHFIAARELLGDLRKLVMADAWNPSNPDLDNLISQMTAPGMEGHVVRLRYMHEHNAKGLALSDGLVSRIDRWLVERRETGGA